MEEKRQVWIETKSSVAILMHLSMVLRSRGFSERNGREARLSGPPGICLSKDTTSLEIQS